MSIDHPQSRMVDICTLAPVIAKARVYDEASAVGAARALVSGGLPAVEIAFNGGAGAPFLRAIRDHVPEAILGVVGLQSAEDAEAAVDAGAQFASGDGRDDALLRSAKDMDLPFMPSCQSLQDVLHRVGGDFPIVRWREQAPVENSSILDVLAKQAPNLSFCVTGPFGPDDAAARLSRKNVACVCGSWLTPSALVSAGDWPAIASLASQAALLGL